MKKYIVLALLLVSTTTPASVTNQESLKIETIKDMYNDAKISDKFDYSYNSIVSLYKYADTNFQKSIFMAYLNANDESGALTECGEYLYEITLEEGGSYSINEIESMDFEILENGRIRVNATISGADFTAVRDYSLTCDNDDNCKITDAYAYDGTSGRNNINLHCM